ncbi:DUF1501 domain-containing protein [Rhodopirellula sp. MGV]|uniref:DUF1501 domain-containing protein n=1 Tax=Rhodopirellula sp. MGV TaxID=2023130 RepID=UPI000B9703E3|nr:DUF1501 domain-containing protein [Rhodopirellula sp. MGV]OYP31625.1 sulfatase [Rhodopirellula sp. MGV]PNY33474.1 DUF1501 domain-containing protein [Rhodopirellula baltica]
MFGRRQFLKSTFGGSAGIFAGLAFDDLVARDGQLTQTLHHPPKAKRVVQLFMAGAASHIDLFDHKPILERHHGQPWDPGETVELFQSTPGACLASPWKFRPYGEHGKPISDIVAPLGEVVDDIAFVHNMVGKTGVHSQGTLLQTTGFSFTGFPSAGSWVSYALGSETENLPSFIVLPDHRGLASNGAKNWAPAFLPAEYQGTQIRVGSDEPIANLTAPESTFITSVSERDGLRALHRLNSDFAEQRPGDDRLKARVQSYELAAKMQLSASDALNLADEPQYIRDMYGLSSEGPGVDDRTINTKAETEFFGRKCLIARRLLERGVRFIQIWSGNDNGFPRRNWDSHENIKRDHEPLAMGMATGAAALIRDLKQRDMLKDTLILWTTEFGRMPCSQGSEGRDHNPFVFTNWLCGGGIKGGTYGESDQWGFRPLDQSNPTQVYDIYATMLHQLGIDHTKLTVKNNGIDRRLTDVHGHVLRDMVS